MRGTNRFVTMLLALLSVSGIVVGVLFLYNERRLEQKRQDTVGRLSLELEPINEERNEWEKKDEEWLNTLTEKKKGISCIMLCFDDTGNEMNNSVFQKMDNYGFRGTLSLKNGVLPGDEGSSLGSEEFQEMLDSGWEYAVSFDSGVQYETEEDVGDAENDTEAESDTDSEVIIGQEWLGQIDDVLARLAEYQWKMPTALFCTREQYDSVSGKDISSRGFSMVRILDTEKFPVIAEREDDLWEIESGQYTQRSDLGNCVDIAIQKGESMAITVNKVVRISKDADFDLSSSKFDSLLSSLKSYEEQEMVHMFTFSEFYEYTEKEEAEYKQLLSQYASFRAEMNEKMEELEQKEQQIVEESRNRMQQE